MTEMDRRTRALFTAASSHVLRLLDFAQLKVLVVAENAEGERFWSGNGKLRNEFVNEGRVDNRSWGMFEVKVNDARPSRTPMPRDHLSDASSSLLDIADIDRLPDAEGEALPATNHPLEGRGNNIFCMFCNQVGHVAAKCPDLPEGARFCIFCHGFDHLFKKCPERARAMEAGVVRNDCDFCQSKTHQVDKCGIKPVDAASCFRCLRLGHGMEACPLPISVKQRVASVNPPVPNRTSSESSRYAPVGGPRIENPPGVLERGGGKVLGDVDDRSASSFMSGYMYMQAVCDNFGNEIDTRRNGNERTCEMPYLSCAQRKRHRWKAKKEEEKGASNLAEEKEREEKDEEKTEKSNEKRPGGRKEEKQREIERRMEEKAERVNGEDSENGVIDSGLYDSSKTLEDCLESLKALGKLRFTRLSEKDTFVIVVRAGENDIVKRVNCKAALWEALINPRS